MRRVGQVDGAAGTGGEKGVNADKILIGNALPVKRDQAVYEETHELQVQWQWPGKEKLP